MDSSKTFVGVVIVLSLIVAGLFIGDRVAEAQDTGLFKVGNTYGLIVGCVPVNPPCYGEKVKVTKVYKNGWFEGTTDDGRVWTYNPAQIISYMEFLEGLKAER